MIVPNAEQIEQAHDSLTKGTTKTPVDYPTLSDFIHDAQFKELKCAVGEMADELDAGYLLGLQTARIVLMQSTALMLAKVKPEDVL